MIHVQSQSDNQLEAIARALRGARRVVMVTGAGISTGAGIPDYRSKGGLYAKGDIFCAATRRDPQRRADTIRSALHLYELARNSQPTESHAFVTALHNAGKLLRCYTQNVDQLHERAGLLTGLRDSVKCIPLHGTVDSLRCPNCCETFEWTEDWKEDIAAGREPPCPRCSNSPPRPEAPPRRASAIGRLRPNFVYLEEAHPQGERIAELIDRDLTACPDMVLVLGTSLRLSGPWRLVQQFARTVGANGENVVYVNLTKASRRGWDSLCDYWVEWSVTAGYRI